MIESVHAIILVNGRYALQLRDNDATITGPGLWGMFGGAIEPGESPVSGLARELQEELEISPERPKLFWLVEGIAESSMTQKRWWVFEVDCSDRWGSHTLHEGQAACLFTFPETTELPMAQITRDVLSCHDRMVRSKADGSEPPRRLP